MQITYEMMTLEQRRIQLLEDIRVTVRDEVTSMHADVVKTIRLIIKEELQIFNKITEQEMITKLDALMNMDVSK